MFDCHVFFTSEPEMRQGPSAGNVRTKTPLRGKGQRSTRVHIDSRNKSNLCA